MKSLRFTSPSMCCTVCCTGERDKIFSTKLYSSSLSSQKMISRARVGPARSAHISADGEMLGVGLKNGGFVVLNANNFKLWGQRRDRGRMINDIR